jgi:hypothetical protein
LDFVENEMKKKLKIRTCIYTRTCTGIAELVCLLNQLEIKFWRRDWLVGFIGVDNDYDDGLCK